MSRDPRIGSQIGPYRVEQELGRGGMGIVYLAEHVHLQRSVALKVLSDHLANDAAYRERFLRESRMAARLRHPNIIPVYDAGEQDGLLFIAMQYVEGSDLATLLESGPLSPQATLRILGPVASALDLAHGAGIVHRDVKPANIMLGEGTGPDGGHEVFLTDFGLVREIDRNSRLTQTGVFVGTLDYAAPEMFQNTTIDGRADQYSLGCVLYECLTGDVPFPRDSQGALIGAHLTDPPPKPSLARPELPAGLDAVVARGMAKSPADRYASCGDMIEAARDAASAHQGRAPTIAAPPPAPIVGAPPPGAQGPPAMPSGGTPSDPSGGMPPEAAVGEGRNRWFTLFAAVVAVIAVVVVVIAVSRGGRPSAGPTTPAPATSAGGTSAPATTPPTTTATSAPPTTPPTTGPTGSPVAPGAHPAVEANTKVGSLPFGVARDATSVWVANQGSGTVTQIDPDTHKVLATRNGVDNAFEIAAGLGSVWVTDERQTLYRLDPAGGRPQAIHMQGGAFGVTEGFGSVWVTNDTSNTVTRLDPNGHVVDRIATGRVPHGIAAGSDSIWVANEQGSVSRIDPATNTPTAEIPVNGEAFQVAEVSGSVWVTNGISQVFQIDPAKNKVVQTMDVGGGSFDVIGGFGSVWLSKSGNNSLVRIDPDTGKETGSVTFGSSPRFIAVGPEGLWVASGDTARVFLVHP